MNMKNFNFIYTFNTIGLTSIASLLAVAPGINAQTVNSGEVEMTATISAFCLFENEIDGTLGVSTDDLATLDSNEAANGITALDGAAGSIDVTCNDPTSMVNISTVTESNTAGATVDTFTTTVTGLSAELVSTDEEAGTPVAVGSTNTETLLVDLSATYDDNLGAGDYTFTVNLEATP